MKRTVSVYLLLLCTTAADYGQATQTITAAGLSRNVTVRRDHRSVPYISALSDDDLHFAQGYIVASDRLWQMDLMRRVPRGETSEIFGKAALAEDQRWRRFNFAKIAEENLNYLSPELRNALDRYAMGVNAYIRSLDENTLPVEFRILQYRPRPWKPADSLLVGKVIADALSNTWRLDLLRASMHSLHPEKLADLVNPVTPYDVVLFGADKKPAAVERKANSFMPSVLALHESERLETLRENSLDLLGFFAEDLAASNNWVVSGKLTADGKPLLANDPHLTPTAPGVWYIIDLSTPGMHVAGVTFPGVPGVVLGHNESIAWGATNVGPDVQDLYYETFNAEGKYKTPTGWETPVVRRETIRVRSNPLSSATEDTVFEVRETRNGPIIIEDGDRKYSLKWTAFDPKNSEFEAFFRLNRAVNWNQFKDALRSYGGPTQNFVYADTSGHIGWYSAGRIPIRRSGHGEVPYDGSTRAGDWIGFIPFGELPSLYDPPGGLIVTANQRTVGTSYKYPQFIRDAASPWRARRIFDRLNAKTRMTMDDMRDVQHEVYNIPLANLSKEVVKLGAASAETRDVLKTWDGLMTPDSRGALLANELRNCLANTIAEENKPAPANVIRERILERAIRERSNLWLPKKYAGFKEFLTACDASVRQSLSAANRLGRDPTRWTWGRVFQSRFLHPLSAAPLIGGQFLISPVGIAGSGHTPNVGAAVSMRFIASPGNWDSTRLVIPLGQSGDPRSPHFRDQFDAWLNGKPQILPFSRTAIEQVAQETIVLTAK